MTLVTTFDLGMKRQSGNRSRFWATIKSTTDIRHTTQQLDSGIQYKERSSSLLDSTRLLHSSLTLVSADHRHHTRLPLLPSNRHYRASNPSLQENLINLAQHLHRRISRIGCPTDPRSTRLNSTILWPFNLLADRSGLTKHPSQRCTSSIESSSPLSTYRLSLEP